MKATHVHDTHAITDQVQNQTLASRGNAMPVILTWELSLTESFAQQSKDWSYRISKTERSV
jgi:hypothetical protein